MRTFLAGFCDPGGPLAKAVGIFLEKTALPWGPRPPLGNFKSYCLKILSLGMRTFLAGFCAPGGPLAKAVEIFLEKQPLPGDHDPPLGISKSCLSKNLKLGDANISGGFCAPRGPLAKAVGIFLKNSPSLRTTTPPPPWEFQKVTSLKIFSMGMRTFLAGFCALAGPLAKA